MAQNSYLPGGLPLSALRVSSFLLLILAGPHPAAHAAYHFWQITEVFSNADGTVQFIEMFDCCNGENYVSGQTLQAISDGVTKTYTLPDNIPLLKPTGGKSMLIATPGFAALPGGVTPDFTLPDPAINGPFFNPNASDISITFFGSSDSITNATLPIPKDGLNSLMRSTGGVLSNGANSPTNVDMTSGSVNLSAPPSPSGDYNGDHSVDAADYIIWRHTLGQPATQVQGADGNANSMIDAGDYDYWKARFGNTVPAAGAGLETVTVPEPAAAALLLGLLTLTVCSRCRRQT